MNIKVKNGGNQKGPRNLHVIVANGKPHAAQRQRQIITEYYGEMDKDVVQWVNERRTLTTQIATPPPSSSSEWSNLECGASSPMVLVGGSLAATFFPIRWEEPSPFIGDMTDCLKEEDG